MAQTSRRIPPKDGSRKLTAIRIKEGDLEVIDARAKAAGITRTDYMLRKSLGLPVGDEDFTEQFERLEERVKRLEEALFSGVGR